MRFGNLQSSLFLTCITGVLSLPQSRTIQGSIQYPTQHGQWTPTVATVQLAPSGPDSPVSGELRLTEVKGGVLIEGTIFGLTPGRHGFHIHAKGDTGNGCLNAGGHFNPLEKTHGSPNSIDRHAGDLGNIITPPHGPTKIFIIDNQISLNPESPVNVVGRAFVVHEKVDDLGLGGDEESLKTGNAGKRLACGIIE